MRQLPNFVRAKDRAAAIRAVAKEAFAKYLTGAGWPNVSVYYQMD